MLQLHSSLGGAVLGGAVLGGAIAASFALVPPLAQAQNLPRVITVTGTWHPVPGTELSTSVGPVPWHVNSNIRGVGGRQLASQGLIDFSAVSPDGDYVSFNGFCSSGELMWGEVGVFISRTQVRIDDYLGDGFAPAEAGYRNILRTACWLSGTPIGWW